MPFPRRTRRLEPSGLRAWPVHALLALAFSSATAARAAVWSAPASVVALAGRGDVLAMGTDCGLSLWDLSSRSSRLVTIATGLPSQRVTALALADPIDELLASTADGLGRGWMDGPWQSACAFPGDEASPFACCAARPGGGWFAGGARGLVVAWVQARLDSLRLPLVRGRIVSIAFAPAVLEPPGTTGTTDSGATLAPGESLSHVGERRPAVAAGAPRAGEPTGRSLASAPSFPIGLAVATDVEGVWILRSTGVRTRWLQLGPRDGLPDSRLLAAVADAVGQLWIATDAGIACAGRGLDVRAWPSDSLLARPAEALLAAPDGCLYVGREDGLVRVVARAGAPRAERVAGAAGPVRALAWATGELWWSDGREVRSLAGPGLAAPVCVACRAGRVSLAGRDTPWAVHTEGAPLAGPGAEFGTLERLGSGSGFVRGAGAPSGAVRAQGARAGEHRTGGDLDLWRRSDAGWQPASLWPGASEVQDLAAAAETLWVPAGSAGPGPQPDPRWQTAGCPAARACAGITAGVPPGNALELFDVRGRCLRRWTVPATAADATLDGLDAHGRRLAAGVYFLRIAAAPGGSAAVRRLAVCR